MFYRVSFEFRVTRRIAWADDPVGFYEHIESVRAKIGVHESVEDVRVITDVAESLLTFDFVIEADRHQQASADALRVARHAIEGSGARHFGLTVARSGVPGEAGASPGLETPVWHYLRMLIDVAA